jgi:predicted RNase H-like HicB family nuclease
MDLHASSVQPSASLHILLEQQADGQIRASVPELLDCSVSRFTREDAIADIQQLLKARLSTLEILEVDLNPPPEAEKPWMKFAGVFKNDPDFAAIVKALREEREIDEDSPAYSLDDIE